MPPAEMQARLASEIDLAGFREEAGTLLAHQVPPDQVKWLTAPNAKRFSEVVPVEAGRPHLMPRAAMSIVPASFLRLCDTVVMHQDPGRFALLYRLLWRLVHEPGLRGDPGDAEMLAAQQMGQAVRRDLQKMKALLRFRPVLEGPDGSDPLHLAWSQPTHHIVEAAAPWFAHRFSGQRWAIMTPQRSARWRPQRQRLEFGPAPADFPLHGPEPDEAALLAGYRAVFGKHDAA